MSNKLRLFKGDKYIGLIYTNFVPRKDDEIEFRGNWKVLKIKFLPEVSMSEEEFNIEVERI